VSYRSLIQLGFQPEMGVESINFVSPDGGLTCFDFDSSTGLYMCQLRGSESAMMAEHFSTEQRKRAVLVKEFHERTNHASEEQMISSWIRRASWTLPLPPRM
jgi:hypothetical protein